MSNAIGICLGASTISIALRAAGEVRFFRRPHDGKVASLLDDVLAEHRTARIGITGRKFRKSLPLPTVSEPEAVELAFSDVKERYPATDCILSAGGETFIGYTLDAAGRIKEIHTGNKCASGTGEFFLQQITRMGLRIEEALQMAEIASSYPVAGRCSVFCKSDCTHALNKGVPKGRVIAGLCQMMAGKIVELLTRAKAGRVAVVGGVSRNGVVMDFVRRSGPSIYVPAEADAFEAFGALLWAERGKGRPAAHGPVCDPARHSFGLLPSLNEGLRHITFKEVPRGEFRQGDYLLGLDVGSTTTKAVLVHGDDRAIVASAYLRTGGDPVGASRACYRQLLRQLPEGSAPAIVGLGVTGSGRQIAGLHALSEGVVNEIVAHATAALHFDPDVETIFEIGGQDAKYTAITNRVPGDYAMNEACSAGTGSFLEEACRESLGIVTEEIAEMALRASAPPNFSDQCAAFIGSDIKTAVQEGTGREAIAAGLVYSVCQNYLNRVKGNRPVGKKIFMQGGVCYNRAVPAAMAVLCGQPIVVPPEPGLMGAFGAALDVRRKIEGGQLRRQRFDLGELSDRTVEYAAPFVCRGTSGSCDRKCSISRILIDGRIYPFGGACDRYNNLRQAGGRKAAGEDLVSLRERLVFGGAAPAAAACGRAVGLLPSLLTHTLYPLYAGFFAGLGLRIVTADEPEPGGMEAAGAAFCFPVLLAHGLMASLLRQKPDHIFLPHVKNAGFDPCGGRERGCSCPLVQGEPYYLRATFHRDVVPKLLTAVLDLQDETSLRSAFAAVGIQLGFSRRAAMEAFELGWSALMGTRREMQEIGRRYLETLSPSETGIVLFGRAYNAFSRLGNMGIPNKFASRGYRIIPHDFLPPAQGNEAAVTRRMYWESGREILKAAEFVRGRPNLFGVYVTSFNCGPDSFLTGYFRDIMGAKPSLMLELDAHTADAGIDTRIEAFLDVVRGYREFGPKEVPSPDFVPASVILEKGRAQVCTADGRKLPLTDPAVTVLLPSMGDASSQGLAAAFRHVGVASIAAEPPGRDELRLGKAVATCKECLPLLLTAGTLERHLRERRSPAGTLVFFMPESDGPCRLGQYRPFFENHLRKNRIEGVALLSLTCENGYAGLPSAFSRRAWQALCIGDGLDDIEGAIRALAADPQSALAAFREGKERIFRSLEVDSRKRLLNVLRGEMRSLAAIECKGTLRDSPKVTLMGEIYVRRDRFSRQFLVERLAEQGIVVRVAPVTEWLHYSDYCVVRGLSTGTRMAERLAVLFKQPFKCRDEAAIQQALACSGFFVPHRYDMHLLVSRGSRLIDPALATEATLTVAGTLAELGDDTHGVISIGPFGCMPCRIAEAILGSRLAEEKPGFSKANGAFWADEGAKLPLPFLAIETDGTPFPQVVEARLESFVLGVRRLQRELAGPRME